MCRIGFLLPAAPWILLSASGTKVASENENVYTEEKLEKIDGMGAVLVFSS